MRAPSHAPRRNTAEEIRQLGATQSKARTRGLVAVIAGVLSAGGLLGAFLLLSKPTPPPSAPLGTSAESPQAELREDPEPAPAPDTRATRTRAGTKRPKDSIASLARPTTTEIARPAGSATPVARGPSVDLEELARSLATQKKGAVQLCFERELKRDPRLKGSAMVQVTLEAPHRVGAITVRDDLDRASFTKCVKTAMKALDFPNLSEDVTVELPFALKTPDF
ncbi:MAG: AgmX/PglI C-terminal domain-containing protein [Myxococcales bacterium]